MTDPSANPPRPGITANDPAAADRPAGTGVGEPAGSPAGLDLDRLAGYLRAHRPDLLDGPLRAALIAGGRSNLTYLVGSGDREFVLRRPPLGHVLATAHDMAREHRVIGALAGTAVPVPAVLLHCPDASVLGAPWYLMQRVPGVVYRSRAQTDRLTGAQRRDLATAMMDVLADLHAIDPAEVGLADFGRPDGFLGRQVRRWGGQLDRSRSRPLPGIDELRERLAATVPEGANAGRIVHGDYRLDNLLAEPDPVRIRAVLDWEMATLGDPLADLGLLLTYWDALGGGPRPGAPGRPSDEPAGKDPAREDPAGKDPAGEEPAGGWLAGNPVADGLGPRAGFPTGAELIDRYAARADVDIGPLHWHVALGCFKLAVICEGIHYRHTLGQTVGEGFDLIGGMVAPLVEYGLTAARES
ncbi:phosphotransferase family protein [Solwaraspora sp. WMMD1047]|uniref:phosphotransferase family protein n=1 Tax=Solwaraspora sp. WMMD1047 TaxID=3016102 RepID=UPI0024177068|nr:phosphotransferase family protein [Solwaraspora sp. WMMD1047]MDG4829890.1 phosphotransferase family protein [Solwaraspora sp. WMMD1047]